MRNDDEDDRELLTFHMKVSTCLNEAAYQFLRQHHPAIFGTGPRPTPTRNAVLRESILGGMFRSIRALLPPPIDVNEDALGGKWNAAPEELDRWKESQVKWWMRELATLS